MSLKDLVNESRQELVGAAPRQATGPARYKGVGILVPVLNQYLDGLNDLPRKQSTRAPGLHCSTLYNLCPRAIWLAMRLPKEDKAVIVVPDGSATPKVLERERIDPKFRMILDVGSACHDLLQNDYLAKARVLFGRWRCSHCHQITAVDDLLPLAPCGTCPKSKWKYQEPGMKLIQDGILVTGFADGVLLINGKKYLFEAKTINSRGFTMLKTAEEGHIFQAQLYMSELQLNSALIVYLNKDTQDVKEFEVHRDESVRRAAFRKIQEALAVQRNPACDIPDKICASPDDKRAKWVCGWAKECFDSFAVEGIKKKEISAAYLPGFGPKGDGAQDGSGGGLPPDQGF